MYCMFDVFRFKKRRDDCLDLAFDDLDHTFVCKVSSTKQGGCLWYMEEDIGQGWI